MHDIVIRGGTIIDGTGAAPFTGDVAITGGRLTGVGGKQGLARRDIDADGLLVTPGWVDVHTHYDGQAMWDPLLAPSCWHGVTSVVMGNCGFTLAPARADQRHLVVRNLERAEDISADAMAQGITWTWETYPEYLDALDQVRTAAHRHGKACGLLVPDGCTAANRRADGWTFIAIGSYTTLLAAAVAVGGVWVWWFVGRLKRVPLLPAEGGGP